MDKDQKVKKYDLPNIDLEAKATIVDGGYEILDSHTFLCYSESFVMNVFNLTLKFVFEENPDIKGEIKKIVTPEKPDEATITLVNFSNVLGTATLDRIILFESSTHTTYFGIHVQKLSSKEMIRSVTLTFYDKQK